ncbi:hypothetical protein [Pseudomonas typographi]|uniref:DUF4124 domain-containing protein n=1 Tax=Pseudomonas typographi TaxID=2715964 RepID=A0ABR7Z4C0_9PSED|nr:hypothetical protein [Pseudomonas typographi]MBD1588227.1 hypothetical protein [Pseudomonas typographi]MBD1600198.1 hypothetical protein [Pseudomonas typographi]
MFQLFFLPAALLASTLEARTFQRCVDATGHLTFTYTLCPPGAEGADHRAYNPPPGSVAPPTGKTPAPRAAMPLVVVGERETTQAKALGAPATGAKATPAKRIKYRPAKP